MHENFEVIIGLEVHVHINTKTKLFSRAESRFGSPANTNISPFCTAELGTLAQLNKEALKKAVRLGLAIGGTIAKKVRFDRKAYFYPDSPKNFQVTQFYTPLVQGGTLSVDVEGEKRIFSIERAHIEEDSALLKSSTEYTEIDFNRAGMGLIEIVTTPCLRSSKEAVLFAKTLQRIIRYLDVSKCLMEEGGMRFDANISIRKKGEKHLRPKVEIKNINSFSLLESAIDTEVVRQIGIYTKNPEMLIESATYRFDPLKKENVRLRKKEQAQDYLYFKEPDLIPFSLSDSFIDKIRQTIPELPEKREKRYLSLGLGPEIVRQLIEEKSFSDYFDAVLNFFPHPKIAAHWLVTEFKELHPLSLPVELMIELLEMLKKEELLCSMAKPMLAMMLQTKKSAKILQKETILFQQIEDEKEIKALIATVLKEFPDSKESDSTFLMGQVKKRSLGRIKPEVIARLLKEKLH